MFFSVLPQVKPSGSYKRKRRKMRFNVSLLKRTMWPMRDQNDKHPIACLSLVQKREVRPSL